MATPAQLAANRRNSTRSTGPRSEAGKQRSARNATSHGLCSTAVLPTENTLLETYREQFQPATPHEHFLVQQMVHARCRLELIQRLELAYLSGDPGEDAAILERIRSTDVLASLNRYAVAAERSYHRAHKELQSARQNEANQRARAASADSDAAYARFLHAINDAPPITFEPELPPDSVVRRNRSTTTPVEPRL